MGVVQNTIPRFLNWLPARNEAYFSPLSTTMLWQRKREASATDRRVSTDRYSGIVKNTFVGETHSHEFPLFLCLCWHCNLLKKEGEPKLPLLVRRGYRRTSWSWGGWTPPQPPSATVPSSHRHRCPGYYPWKYVFEETAKNEALFCIKCKLMSNKLTVLKK